MRTASVFTPRSVSQQSNGPGHRAHRVLGERQLLGELVVVGDQRAADDVGVAAEVLRGGVQHDVGAERERLLQVGRGEGVVDDEPRAGLARATSATAAMSAMPSSGFVGVSHQTTRVVGPQRRAQGVEVGEVDRRVLDAPRREHLVDQPERAAVGVVRDDDVVAGAQQHAQQDVARRPSPTRTRGRAGRPPARPGTPAARCGWGWRCARTRSPRPRPADAVLGEGRRQVQRGDHRAGGGVGLLPGVDGLGGEAAHDLQATRRPGHARQLPRNASTSERVTTPAGLPSTSTSAASAAAKADIAVSSGSFAPIVGSGGRHVLLEPVRELGPAGEQRVEQVALDDRPGHLRGHHRRLGPHDRHLRDV